MSAPVDSAAITAAALEEVQMEMRSYVNTSSHTYKKIKASDTRPVNVRGTFIPAIKAPNGTFGAFAEGGVYAQAGGRQLQRWTATYRRYSMSTAFSNDALESTDMMVQQTLSGNKESDGLQIGVQCDIMCFGDGKGFRATVQVDATGSTDTLTFYIDDGTGVGLNDMGTTNFFTDPNSQYEFRSPAGVLRAGGPYACLTQTGATATFDGNINAAVVKGDYIVYAGNYNGEFQGYPYHLDNDPARTYQGLSSADYTVRMFPYVEDVGGEMLTVAMMQRVVQSVITKRGVDYKTPGHYWLLPPAQNESYLGLGQALGAQNSSLMRDQMPGGNLDVQWKTTSYAGQMIDVNEKMPTTEVYYIHDALLQRYPLREVGMQMRGADAEGLRLTPAFSTSAVGNWADQSSYTIVLKENFGSADPAMAGRLKNVGTDGLLVPAIMDGN